VSSFTHSKDKKGIRFTTSGQSNLTQGRIAAANGRFNRIRQVPPMCPPMRRDWCHLANTIELVLPSAHPSPQPKQHIIGSAIFSQLTAESPYTLQ